MNYGNVPLVYTYIHYIFNIHAMQGHRGSHRGQSFNVDHGTIVLDGKSEIGAHLWIEIGNLICVRYL